MTHIDQVYARHENEPIIDRFEHIQSELQISSEAIWDFMVDKLAENEQFIEGELYGDY